ncbi:hypothetical protein KKD42_03340 [Patescibacteria group bacterium]|nr:hypothetical protein [Patescibacteria group bacterium]
MKKTFNLFCYFGSIICSLWALKALAKDESFQTLVAAVLAILFLYAYDHLFAGNTKEEALEEANKVIGKIRR